MIFEMRDVACGYEKGNPVLDHVSLELKSGEICCILGPNGVGKTTLFRTILNLQPSLGGQILLDGQDLTKWTPKQRARAIAYVAQAHTPAFPYKVKDIALMGRLGQVSRFAEPTKKDLEIAEQAMEDMGIRHLREQLYTDISGGERQILMIAKALAQQPEILILDEPTANLDYGNMARVIAKLRQLADQGICVIMTTHLPDQAFMCNSKTLLVMRHHPVIFGDCAEVITENNLQRAYHTPVQIIEIIDRNGEPLRVCRPRFDQMQDAKYDYKEESRGANSDVTAPKSGE